MNKRSGKLVITRGLPGSGKTTWAKSRDGVRVNRDDLRDMMFGAQGILPWDQELLVTEAQQSAVRNALKHDRTVYVDDTNLRLKYVRVWEQMAQEENVEFQVVDFFNADLEECIRRDYQRMTRGGRWVTGPIIRAIHAKFLAQHDGRLPEYEYGSGISHAETVRQYVADTDLPPAIIVDLDGTLANRRVVNGSMRGPFDWERVGEDELSLPVAAIVNNLGYAGFLIIFVSGRDECCRLETEDWLHNNVQAQGSLYMRKAGDSRKDTVVKSEIFWEHLAPKYNVFFTLDDRNSVVAMWRAMGIKCLQVQEGNF